MNIVMARSAWLAPLLMLATCALSACGAASEASPRTGPNAVPSPISSSATSPTPTSPGGSASLDTPKSAVASRPPDRIAASYTPVKRNGAGAQHRITADPGTFTTPVTYTDGLRVSVLRVSNGVDSAQGAGAYPGTAVSRVTLRVTNGSAQPVDLNNVVVQLTYGKPARVAQAVYDDTATRDFASVVKPGRAVDGVYAYAVPSGARGDLTMHVDLDALHAVAALTGAAR